MKKRTALTALAVIAAAALILPSSPANAQEDGELFVLHGINLDGQDDQEDGSTSVTVCLGDGADDEPLFPDFQFGQFLPAGSLPVGTELQVVVIFGADESCDAEPALVQDYTVEAGATVLVATGVTDDTSGFNFQLTPFGVDVDCTEPGTGRLTAAHASAGTGPVELVSGGVELGTLSFGTSATLDLPEGEYDANVLAEGIPVFDPDLGIELEEGDLTMVFVVGNLPDEGPETAIVALAAGLEVGVCDGPPTPDPDPQPISEPDPEAGPTAPGAPGAAAGERPLALTG